MGFRKLLALLTFSGMVYFSVSDGVSKFRIISGRRASTLEFPYMAEIQKRKIHWCGGSVIHKFFVLSAAHCFCKGNLTEPADLYKVIVGNDELLTGGTVYKVKRFLIHENYNNLATMDEYDIGLAQLLRPIRYTDRVQPVSLAEATPRPGKRGWVIGYGKTDPTKVALSKYLMAVRLPVVDLKKCQKTLRMVANDMICAGRKKSTEDACQGDSGGPYVVEKRQVGVVAWGIGCGREGFPGVYTNVAYYKGWIESKIAEHSKSELIK